jgi:antitoxin component of MazEF toxin-antitoxin module
MKIQGIKRGQNIELAEDINIPDGTALIIEISDNQIVSDEERKRKLKEFFDKDWEGKEDFIMTMRQLEEEDSISNTLEHTDTSHTEGR